MTVAANALPVYASVQPERAAIIQRSLEAGLNPADFKSRGGLSSEYGQIRLLSQENTASIQTILIYRERRQFSIEVNFLAQDTEVVQKTFLSGFQFQLSPHECGRSFTHGTRVNCTHEIAILFLSRVARYNLISAETLSDVELLRITRFESNAHKIVYMYETLGVFNVQRIILTPEPDFFTFLPKVTFIANLAQKTVKVIVQQLTRENSSELFNTDFKWRQQPRKAQVEAILIKPGVISKLFDRFFTLYIVPEEAQTTIRNTLEKVVSAP